MRALLLVLLALAACSEEKKGGGAPQGRRGPMEFPVEVQPVEIRDVEYEIRADGTVDVFERVQVTARVAGVVEKVAFREGDTVKAGAVLATIDPARYDLAAKQAGAAVSRAKAAFKDAEAGLARRTKADSASPGLIPAEEIASWETKVEQARADVSEKEITAQRARLDRKDAYVRAPVAGVVQSRDATTGMYAQPGTLLATLVQREPLLVRFDVDETEASRVTHGVTVRFTVEGDGREHTAKVSHVAEVADPKSRLVRVTAEVTSEGRDSLRAGGFAQVVVPVGGTVKAPVIPELAIRPSERGFLVFTVADGVAHERIVELGLRTPDGKVEVKKGLAAGDQLVVRGAEALREGAKVKIAGGAPP
jgi:multidrug efflux system membrane fusion protein